MEAVAIEFRKQAQPEQNTAVGLIGSGNIIIQVLFYILSHTCILFKSVAPLSDVKKQEATIVNIDVLVSSADESQDVTPTSRKPRAAAAVSDV